MQLAFLDFKNEVVIITDGIQALYNKIDSERELIKAPICTDKNKIAKLDNGVRFPADKLAGRVKVDRERLIYLLKSVDSEYAEISIYKNVRDDYEESNLIAVSGGKTAASLMAVVIGNDFWRPFEK